jgi:hypothetical protein
MVFSLLIHKPILLALNPYINFPTIIRLSATCKWAYNEWIKIVQEVMHIEREILWFYKRRYIKTIFELRQKVKECYLFMGNTMGLFTCVRCGNAEYGANLINLNLSKHTICYNCFATCPLNETLNASALSKYIETLGTRVSQRSMLTWFNEHAVALFNQNGEAYSKESYYVVNIKMVKEKYGNTTIGNRVAKRRRKK